MSEGPRASAVKPLEDALAELRAASYARSPDAAELARVLRERIERFASRVDVVSAIASPRHADADPDCEIDDLSQRLRTDPMLESEVAIDLAAALWVCGKETEAIDVAGEAVEASPTGIDPNLFLPVIELLFRTRRTTEADRLTRAFLGEFSLGLGEAPPAFELTNVSVDTRSRVQFLDRLLVLMPLLSATGQEEDVVDRLRAATLCELGRLEEGLNAARLELDRSSDPSARWVAAVACHRLGRLDSALQELDALGPADASRPQVLALRIRLLSTLEDPSAIQVADAAVEANPDEIGLRIERVRARAKAGHSREAHAELDQLIATHDDHGELWRAKGHLFRWEHDLPEAVEAFEQALERNQKDARAMSLLGQTVAEMGEVERGLAVLDRALVISPEPSEVLYQRAKILHGQARDVEALDVIRHALERGRQDHLTYGLHADILRALERDDEAMVWYRKALDIGHGVDDDEIRRCAEALDALVLEQHETATKLAEENKYDQALEVLTRLGKDGLLTTGGMSMRSELLRVTRRRREAVTQADQALAAGADVSFASGSKAMALVELNRSAKGIAVIDPVLADAPDYMFGWYVRIAGLDELGDVNEALSILDERFPMGPTTGEWVVMARSQLLIDLGRYDDAVAGLEEALKAGANADWLAPLGAAYSRLGKPGKAIEKLRQAIDMTGSDTATWALNELGDALSVAPDRTAGEVAAAYARVLDAQLRELSPRDFMDRAWAQLRTGATEAAIASFRSAFDEAEDPVLLDHFRLGMALEMSGAQGDADAELDRTLATTAALPDRERARAILKEARTSASLLQADQPKAIRAATVARLKDPPIP